MFSSKRQFAQARLRSGSFAMSVRWRDNHGLLTGSCYGSPMPAGPPTQLDRCSLGSAGVYCWVPHIDARRDVALSSVAVVAREGKIRMGDRTPLQLDKCSLG